MTRGIDANDTIEVLQRRLVAGKQCLELAAIAERRPGRLVGERVGSGIGCDVQRRPLPRSTFAIPAVAGGIDSCCAPKPTLGFVGAALITTRQKERLVLGNR